LFEICWGETVRSAAGLDDAAVVDDPIKQRGGHLGIAEHRHPFTELEVGRDNDAGGFLQLADPLAGRRMHAFAEKEMKQE
jgi:hypothetical protein